MKKEIALFLVLTLLVPGCMGDSEPDIFYGEDISPPVPVSDFILTDQNGDPFQLSEFEGKVVVVTCLFTRCPDIFPIVSANLDYLSNMLGDDYGDSVEILTITVDPWTDNSSVLHNYSEQRGLHWPHLTGSVEDLEGVWLEFDVGLQTYSIDSDGDGVSDGFDTCLETPEGEEVDSNGCGLETQQEDDGGDVTVKHHPLDYWVDHTTGTIILDKQLRQRVWWGDTDWNVELAMEDIKILISEEE